MLAAPAASAAPPGDGKHLTSQVEKLDRDGGEVRGLGWPTPKQPAYAVPEPVWPKAGSARATLSATARQRAGDLPVSLARAPGSALAAVDVQVLDRAKLPARWRDGMVARLSVPAATATATAMNTAKTSDKAAVSVDYSGFQYAYGAEWASRLRLWRLPECALTTPDRAECSATPLPTRREGASVTAVTQATTLVALAAAPAGDSGDFTATSLAPSSTWAVGQYSGAFEWNYPMRVPPMPGGVEPKINLSYSSSSVDGRSSATNNQPSWIGEGFDFWPGFIERRYVGCSDDKADSPNNPSQTGDLCWRSSNAVLSLNGTGSELVYESGKGWHARSEDGSKVERLTGASNGDNDGEYWKVTGSDGTQYFFGQSSGSNSTWTVPVYGNHSGEPCHATAFSDSDCEQAWRWNLDYVVDPRGNTMSLSYAKETNQYAAEATSSKNVSYVRGGTLTRIDYGTWDRGSSDRSTTPTAQVIFESADRCLADCSTHDGSHWPDTPWDQECKAGATSCDDYSPTFWTTKRLAKITTRVWDTSAATPAWQDVDSWTLGHSFPSPGDGQKAGLWLSSVTHTGLVGTPIAMPPTTFDPVALRNRVLTKTNTTNNWQRLAAIHTETGAIIQVTYSLPECTASDLPSSPQNNTKLCFPVVGPDPYSTSGGDITEWWHKYVVRQITETDIQLADGHQAPPKNTYFTYGGTPAWHYADDDGLSKPKYKTWNQFRGYGTVDVQVGDSAKTLTRTTYLRGMHGDKLAPTGGVRSVTVPASVGSETVYDEDQFAGMIREQVIYNGSTSKPVSKIVNVPWRSAPTASRTINGDTVTARFVNYQTVYQSTALGVDGSRGWRTTSTTSQFDDAYGTVESQQDNGDIAKSGDEKCTTTVYNRNVAKNIVTLPRRTTVTALPCGTAPTSADHMISDSQLFYDGATDPATAPVYGENTRADALRSWTAAGGTVWRTVAKTGFDAFGREISETDLRGNTSSIAYSPATGPVLKKTTTTQQGWVSSDELNPYWGLPWKATDANGKVSEATYDGLGRVSAAWNKGWSRTSNPSKPSSKYEYVYSATRSAYPYVKTEALNAGGGYTVSYNILDGFLRPRQTQAAAVGGGRVVTDTLYDAAGRAETTFQAHAEPDSPSGTLWWEPDWSVPAQTRTVYDQANRATASIFLSGDGVTNVVERWRTSTTYEGDRTTVVPPTGGTVETKIVDADGRTVELRQYNSAQGSAGTYYRTTYTYNAKDELAAVADDAGDAWTYKYDIRGRLIESKDPDKGLTRSGYTDYDELQYTIDANDQILVYAYDALGRKLSTSDGSLVNGVPTATTKRAEWVYDKLYTGVTVRGQLTQSLRYVGADTYKSQVRGFTDRGQPTGVNYVIPASQTGLAGTYVYGFGYSPYTGQPTSISYPAGGGLPDEGVTTGYDATTGLPTTLTSLWSSTGTYVAGQQYTSYAEPTVTTLKTAGGVYTEQNVSYDVYTRRVDTVTVKPETATGTVSNVKYSYDDAGNILGLADTPQVGVADYQCYGYDALRRLTTAWTPATAVDCKTATPSVAGLGGPAPYWQDWTIDRLGNRTKEVSHAATGDTTRDYTVPAPGADVVRPHAVTGMTTTVPGQNPVTVSYGYDANGNTIGRPGTSGTQTLTWDPEGHLSTVSEGGNAVETNVYDADGNRLIRRDATGASLFLPGMEIRRTGSGSTPALSATRYYTFGDRLVASRTSSSTSSLTWLFSDNQGTQLTGVNAATQQVTIRRQTPYGTPRGTAAAWPNARGFVGGDNDPTGLVHLGARDYDPVLGRFISVDPEQDLNDPRQWNAYAYANSNPILFADPDGRMVPAEPSGPTGGSSSVDDLRSLQREVQEIKRRAANKWLSRQVNLRHEAAVQAAAAKIRRQVKAMGGNPNRVITTFRYPNGCKFHNGECDHDGKPDIVYIDDDTDTIYFWEVKSIGQTAKAAKEAKGYAQTLRQWGRFRHVRAGFALENEVFAGVPGSDEIVIVWNGTRPGAILYRTARPKKDPAAQPQPVPAEQPQTAQQPQTAPQQQTVPQQQTAPNCGAPMAALRGGGCNDYGVPNGGYSGPFGVLPLPGGVSVCVPMPVPVCV
ncbi:RHS repeat-associated core domain-containing protein [Actinoplanes oblitus]|uniref:RHS repeat-associated core domain-containing protein n=1 Tax=Actinoplanes oblitus TaxID=3040509 RepID=A0ABY8WHT7_9ACTN|nr:RHS repeat-associated core domain-containing protein [Actinoplanes oblitus]WIM96410.1 RHS repeat-associated core domain-containing protein [Actinoplanes oblitus]